jgi:hypothetical protein
MYILITLFLLGCQCNEFTYTSLMEVFTQTKQYVIVEKMME